jgi:hypothetical protein
MENLTTEELQNYENNINGFSEILLLKLINYTFNNNFNFNIDDKKLITVERKTNEIKFTYKSKTYLLFLDIVDNLYKTPICTLMSETEQFKDEYGIELDINFDDEFKHQLLLSINNLIGMAKLVFISIQQRYNILSNFNLEVSSELLLYFDKNIDKCIGIKFIKQ